MQIENSHNGPTLIPVENTGDKVFSASIHEKADFIQAIRNVLPDNVQQAPTIGQIIQILEKDHVLHIINADVAADTYAKFIQTTENKWTVYAAIKAMHNTIARRFNKDFNSRFEVASGGEIERCIDLGIPGSRLLYTNPPKMKSDLILAVSYGVQRYVIDTSAQLQKLHEVMQQLNANFTPEILIRIGSGNIENHNVDGSFDKRFGIPSTQAFDLIKSVSSLGYKPIGLSFHVGTHKNDPDAWDRPIKMAATVYKQAHDAGITLDCIDIGGGFPSSISSDTRSIETFYHTINQSLHRSFNGKPPAVICEPGRALCGTSGITLGKVIDVKYQDEQIVTVNTGFYNAGLILGIGLRPLFFRAANQDFLQEDRDDVSRFSLPAPLVADKHAISSSFYGLAGASLDTPFSFYDAVKAPALQEGDLIIVLGTGAYATDLQTNWCSIPQPLLLIVENNAARIPREKSPKISNINATP